MSDLKTTAEVLDNLNLLMNFDLLKNEKDWVLLRDLDDVPPAPKKPVKNETDADYDN